MTGKSKRDMSVGYGHMVFDNPLLVGLAQATPITAGLQAALQTNRENEAKEKQRVLFEYLESGRVKLTEEVIQSNDFIQSFSVLERVVMRTRRNEKIDLFVKLLNAQIESVISVDEFDELLSILDDLSYREINMLIILHGYENRISERTFENELERANSFWYEFCKQVETDTGTTQQEMIPFLMRLTRSGFVAKIEGFWNNGIKGSERFMTTVLLNNLASAVRSPI